MPKVEDYDICVIGAGSAGLSVAAGAAQLGARTILFERAEMGGDCLNYGCVPSKALLAAAHAAHEIRGAERFGIHCAEPEIDFAAVMAHVRNVIATIAPHDSVPRFEELGVRVVKAEARFAGPREVSGGGVQVRARRIVIATGSRAVIPQIPGIGTVAPFTNETIFSLTARPEHLVIIGGGPIGMEMAQAFRRLGSRVTVLEARRLLERDEPEFSDILRRQLSAEGIALREGVQINAVTKSEAGIALTLSGETEPITGTHLLVAAGRRPRLDGLDLEKAGVATTAKGITVDARLRTSNPRIYAIGDAAGGPQFTHVAGYHAGLVIRNTLFRLPARTDYRALPWVTYCDPELAHVGLTEAEARARYGNDVRTVTAPFKANDRAQAERDTAGAIKVITRANGMVLGASIVGRGAGELLPVWSMAITRRLKLSTLTGLIFPYPTRSEISKAAASAFYSPKLFSRWPRRLVRLILRMS
ncbi:MAG: FAD-dependent oxidoreductase [Alphaproteobacteria bacterium]|nr:FAD-dependent oxidoreductase [Alphaproteobacteria bacterium]MDE2013022.1 FAD-dependent oxidoreductase [Alphaproteobacteria bacterium]MDE2072415.1 FAD-dependent oxidoreductase [Alphaproteobacteria bacterium]